MTWYRYCDALSAHYNIHGAQLYIVLITELAIARALAAVIGPHSAASTRSRWRARAPGPHGRSLAEARMLPHGKRHHPPPASPHQRRTNVGVTPRARALAQAHALPEVVHRQARQRHCPLLRIPAVPDVRQRTVYKAKETCLQGKRDLYLLSQTSVLSEFFIPPQHELMCMCVCVLGRRWQKRPNAKSHQIHQKGPIKRDLLYQKRPIKRDLSTMK